jgi:hypothetical protein
MEFITRLENAILQVQTRFVGGTSASTCKTFSNHVIHNIFSADNLFKAKYGVIKKDCLSW